ncbi:MAG: sigma-70 family RNA polymerase sigma factor [Acidobacteriota bacterium]|nr:sigma-70 family RNA polymerase sigma factor [Acidobacteriota bacterium]
MATTFHNKIWAINAEKSGESGIACAEISDKILVERVLAGDETAFEQLFERHKRLVACVAARFFRQPPEIEEIVQITFTKVYFDLKNFRSERELSLQSFLARIAINSSLDVLRSRKRKSENFFSQLNDDEKSDLLEILCGEYEAENDFINRDLAEKLLSRLDAEDRALLEMLDAEEMTVAEVSEITGWSNAKIKVKAFRARSALRKVLKRFL